MPCITEVSDAAQRVFAHDAPKEMASPGVECVSDVFVHLSFPLVKITQLSRGTTPVPFKSTLSSRV